MAPDCKRLPRCARNDRSNPFYGLDIGEPEIHLTASAGISGRESTSLIAGAEQTLHVARDKYEALVRLVDEDGSIVAPFFFLEAARRTRQYAMLTRAMIEQSLGMLGDCPISISLTGWVWKPLPSTSTHRQCWTR